MSGTDDIVIIAKNTKITHTVFSKVRTLIMATHEGINETNFSLILTKIMRELNKNSLYGFEKKRLAVEIMTLLLDEFAPPEMSGPQFSEKIVETIEIIYAHNMHRYKTENKCKII